MEYYENGAMTIKLDDELPAYPAFLPGYRRAPRREAQLSEADKALPIRNALRYIHPKHHAQMAEEFARELEERGRIYGYRFRPEGKLYGKSIEEYKGNCVEAKAFQVMIDNNLDFDVAQNPEKQRERLTELEKLEGLYQEILEKDEAVSVKELAVDGKDLIASGVKAIPFDVPENEMKGCVHLLKNTYRKYAVQVFIRLLYLSKYFFAFSSAVSWESSGIVISSFV